MRAILLLLPMAAMALSAQVADEAFFKGDPVQVMLACSNRAQALKPHNSRLMAEHGRAYLAAGERSRAEAILAEAEREDRFDPATFKLIAEAWLKIGEQAPVPGLLKRAKEFQNEWRDPAPLQFAALMMDHGMTQEARDAMALGFGKAPDWEYAVDFAKSCLRKGLRDDAAEWFSRAVNLRKGNPDIWHQIALAMADTGYRGHAAPVPLPLPKVVTPGFFLQDMGSLMLTCVDAFRPKKERDSGLSAEDGLVRLVAGDQPGAEACFRDAIKQDPEDGNVYVVIGEAWLRCGHHVEAITAYDDMQRLDPKDGSSFMKAARSLLRAGDESAASDLMEKGAQLEPASWTGPGDFAKEALAQGKLALAAHWFAKEVAAAPVDWSAWNDIGQGYANLRLTSTQMPPPRVPKAHPLWISIPLNLELPDPKRSTTGSTFMAIYPDQAAFRKEVALQIRAALPSAQPLPEAAPNAPPTEARATAPSSSDDRIVSLEKLQVVGGTQLEGRRTFAYEDAAILLQLRDGQGHLLRSLTFRESTVPSRALAIPQADLATLSKTPKPKSLKDAVDSACLSVSAFLASPAFGVWAD